ncbi:hypothetical protein RB593_005057 [Gaeumannomyces tritici]
MKTSQVAAVLVPVATVNAQWWGGAPQCASSCMSSAWNNPTSWPEPTSLCAGGTPAVATCVQSACAATPTVWSSYSSLSSSLCSKYASCTSGGTGAVRTITATGGTWNGGWWNDANKWGGPDGKGWNGNGKGGWKRDGPHGFGGPGGKDWPKTLTSGQVYTVTGCDWNDGYWGGFGWGVGKGGPWGWGTGWTAQATSTGMVTKTWTAGGSAFTTTAPATFAVAVSGSVTSTATLGLAQQAEATGTPGTPGTPAPNAAAGSNSGVKVAGAALAGFVGVALAL